MDINKHYENLLNNMSFTSLEKEKESIINILANTTTIDSDFYPLIKKLELIYKITLEKFQNNAQSFFS